MRKKTLKRLLIISIVLLIVQLSYLYYLHEKKRKVISNKQEKNSQVIQSSTLRNSFFSPASKANKEEKLDENKAKEEMTSIELTPKETVLQKNPVLNQRKIGEINEKKIKVSHIHQENFHSTFGRRVVFIYFSHNRESFLPYFKEGTTPQEAYHSKFNITLIGEYLGNVLKQYGIGNTVSKRDIITMLNERNLNFGSSYEMSRQLVLNEKKVNHHLEMNLDIHRDAIPRSLSTITINGVPYARVSFVIGSNHKNYKENLKFANAIHSLIQKNYQGLSKGVIIKNSDQGDGVYNQDLSPNSVIIEIGGVENHLDELYRTAEILGNVIDQYYWENINQ